MNAANFTLMGTMTGSLSVACVFVLLIVLLIKLPPSVLSMLDEANRPWWKRSRLWAIGIAAVQVVVYLVFG